MLGYWHGTHPFTIDIFQYLAAINGRIGAAYGLIMILNNEGKQVVAAEVRHLRFMSIIFAVATAVAGYLYFGEDSLGIMLTAMAGY